MFVMKTFAFEVDLGTLFTNAKRVHSVTIDGMEINIPPKGERPNFHSDEDDKARPADDPKDTGVIIEKVLVTNSALRIFPRDKKHEPLHFGLHRIQLESAGKNVAMKYDATLTNPKPPGELQSKGTFGPWAAPEPGDTPLGGQYDFQHADLGIFSSIAGILNSTGNFERTLSSIQSQWRGIRTGLSTRNVRQSRPAQNALRCAGGRYERKHHLKTSNRHTRNHYVYDQRRHHPT